jgi:surface protein
MFQGASAFNQDLSKWDVSKVTNMSCMFVGASAFNQDLSKWDVSKVTNMRYMFQTASAFNQDLSKWDVSKVKDSNFQWMFRDAHAFNQCLAFLVPHLRHIGYRLVIQDEKHGISWHSVPQGKKDLISMKKHLQIRDERQLMPFVPDLDVSIAPKLFNKYGVDDNVVSALMFKKIKELPKTIIKVVTSIRNGLRNMPRSFSLLSDALCESLKDHDVSSKDIKEHVTGTQVHFDISIKTSTPRAVEEALNDTLEAENAGLQPGKLASAFLNQGLSIPRAHVEWCLEYIQTIIQLKAGIKIPMEYLEPMVGAVNESYKLYAAAWKEMRASQPEDTDALIQMPSKSRFYRGSSTQLLTYSEATGLEEAFATQGATTQEEILDDGKKAQASLKQRLAPGTEWAASEFTEEVLLSDSRRTWHSSSADVAPNGSHFDPGTKSQRRIQDKLERRGPDGLRKLVDISRLGIVFVTPSDTGKALSNIQEIFSKPDLQLAWVDNKFARPSAVGYRDLNLGVQQVVNSRVHVSELQLLVKPLYDVKQGRGHDFYEVIQSMFAKCLERMKADGIATKVNEHEVQKLIVDILVHKLDFTAGRFEAETKQFVKMWCEKGRAISDLQKSGFTKEDLAGVNAGCGCSSCAIL